MFREAFRRFVWQVISPSFTQVVAISPSTTPSEQTRDLDGDAIHPASLKLNPGGNTEVDIVDSGNQAEMIITVFQATGNNAIRSIGLRSQEAAFVAANTQILVSHGVDKPAAQRGMQTLRRRLGI